jgi:hypothetical protein
VYETLGGAANASRGGRGGAKNSSKGGSRRSGGGAWSQEDELHNLFFEEIDLRHHKSGAERARARRLKKLARRIKGRGRVASAWAEFGYFDSSDDEASAGGAGANSGWQQHYREDWKWWDDEDERCAACMACMPRGVWPAIQAHASLLVVVVPQSESLQRRPAHACCCSRHQRRRSGRCHRDQRTSLPGPLPISSAYSTTKLALFAFLSRRWFEEQWRQHTHRQEQQQRSHGKGSSNSSSSSGSSNEGQRSGWWWSSSSGFGSGGTRQWWEQFESAHEQQQQRWQRAQQQSQQQQQYRQQQQQQQGAGSRPHAPSVLLHLQALGLPSTAALEPAIIKAAFHKAAMQVRMVGPNGRLHRLLLIPPC